VPSVDFALRADTEKFLSMKQLQRRGSCGNGGRWAAGPFSNACGNRTAGRRPPVSVARPIPQRVLARYEIRFI